MNILVFDIGNSNIVLGTYEGKKLVRHWRISTDRQKTGDEYGMLRYDCSGGDGIHLQTHCYSDFLSTLFNFLDDTSVKEQIEKSER